MLLLRCDRNELRREDDDRLASRTLASRRRCRSVRSDHLKPIVATDRSARLVEIISPAGFEQFFVELADLLKTDRDNLEAAAALGAKYGVERDPEATARVAAEHGLIDRLGKPVSRGAETPCAACVRRCGSRVNPTKTRSAPGWGPLPKAPRPSSSD